MGLRARPGAPAGSQSQLLRAAIHPSWARSWACACPHHRLDPPAYGTQADAELPGNGRIGGAAILRKAAVIGTAMVALAVPGIGTALADRPSGTTPALTDIVGVATQTMSHVWDQFAADYNASHPGVPISTSGTR